MTESVLSLRVSKINGAPMPTSKRSRSLMAFVRPGNRHYSKCLCSGEQTLTCTKIFKIFFSAIGKQSIIVKLIDNKDEIASLSIPLSWIPREYYIAESFPLRPLIPGIATPIAFVEIQISSNENALPFTLPPADLIHIPAWRPYPKVELPVKTATESNRPSQNSQSDAHSNRPSQKNQNGQKSPSNEAASQQTSLNIKLTRKRSSSLCLENVPKLNELISDNSSSSGDDYTEESSIEPAVEHKMYMAFSPPIMKNGMEPARLEPKKYSDAELSDILSKHAYSGALLNGQYINPPKCFTKNLPLCEKIANEMNKIKPTNKHSNNSMGNSNNSMSNSNNSKKIESEKSHRRHRHSHKAGGETDNYRVRSNSKTPASVVPGGFFMNKNDPSRIDQRSNSGKGFFQKGRMQKFLEMKKSFRLAPPPEYQELNNDVLFKDDQQ